MKIRKHICFITLTILALSVVSCSNANPSEGCSVPINVLIGIFSGIISGLLVAVLTCIYTKKIVRKNTAVVLSSVMDSLSENMADIGNLIASMKDEEDASRAFRMKILIDFQIGWLLGTNALEPNEACVLKKIYKVKYYKDQNGKLLHSARRDDLSSAKEKLVAISENVKNMSSDIKNQYIFNQKSQNEQ